MLIFMADARARARLAPAERGGGRYGKVPREIGWPVSTRRGELDSGRTVSANPFLVALGRLRTG